MSLASVSIRNPVFAWMMMLGIIMVGAVSFTRLGVGLLPDVDRPLININAALQGADPEIMESEVVDVLEDAVMAVQGVREVTSRARQGGAWITVEFEPEKDIDVAFQDVQARIYANTRLLPADMDPPTIMKSNPEDEPIMFISLVGNKSPREMSDYAKNALRDRFLTVPDTGDVQMPGYLDRNMRIWLKPAELQSRNLSVDEVIRAVQRESINLPGGRMEGTLRESNVKVEGEALNLEQWKKLRIAEYDGAAVCLGEVAMLEDGYSDVRNYARVNGRPAQGLGIIKQHGGNSVALAAAVRERLAEVNRNLPEGMELAVRVDQTKFIREAYEETVFTLVLAVLLTAFVCWLFLGSLSSTLNVVLAIPVSIFGTFAVIYFFGFTLNLFTLLALSLSIGLVVDDAIMVLENIYRHAEAGHDRVLASRLGAEQIQFPALAATLSIVAIFGPVIFMPGVMGKFFFQFGIVLSAAVMISLLEALTLAPMRTSQFLRVSGRGNVIERAAGATFGALAKLYRRILQGVLGRPVWRYAVLLVAFGAFGASLLLLFRLKWEEVPAQDQGMFALRVECPVGSALDYTDGVIAAIETELLKRQDVEGIFASIGSFGGDASGGFVWLMLKARAERGKSQQEIIEEVGKALNRFPGTDVTPMDPSRRGLTQQRGPPRPVIFSLRGPDWEKLGELSRLFPERMEKSGKMSYITTDYKVGMPEVKILPNREKTLAHNVDIQTLGATVQALIGGVEIAKFTSEGRRYDVRVRLLRDQRLRPEDVGNLYVRNRDGELVKLSEVAEVVTRPSMQVINRTNRSRSVTVMANLTPGTAQGEALQEVEKLAKELLPPQYELVFTGSSKAARESIGLMLFAFAGGLIVAYMVLASQFNSYLHPFTILLALPFSISGALLALFAFGQTLNIFSILAIILLAGIVKKNSILLVDFTNHVRRQGKGCLEALKEACPIRLRPILMTSVATIAGALPGALALGPGGELRIPMCLAVVGGVFVSTLLTLLVVPCFYAAAEDVRALLFRSPASASASAAMEPAVSGK